MAENLVAVTILGRDRPGLVADISKHIARVNGNIVDIEQNVVRGLFSMFVLVDLGDASIDCAGFARMLSECASRLSVGISITQFAGVDRAAFERQEQATKYVATILGGDKPGIVAAVAGALSEAGVNTERTKMVARGEFFAMEMGLSIPEGVDVAWVRAKLRAASEPVGVDVVLQPEGSSRFRKRLIVFDMDSTVVDGEVIDELAKVAGVGEQVAAITALGMEGKMDFKEGLRARVKLLAGLPVEKMERVRREMKLTPGFEELRSILKSMGFKLGLVSGGFTYFTDDLKERLSFDYAYANELVIRDGKLTGEVSGEIIDSAGKAAILEIIRKKEGLAREEVVAVGDGANDRIMLQTAGLGIAFNAKEALKKTADGSIAKQNLKGLLYCIGAANRAGGVR